MKTIIHYHLSRYHLIYLGRQSRISLSKNHNVNVVYKDHTISAKTHNTYTNRIDGIKNIVKNFPLGSTVHAVWIPSKNTLILS